MSNAHLIAAIAVMSLMTMLTRFAPFLLFSKKETPAVVVGLGKCLPYAIIGMLVVFCMKNVSFTAVSTCVPELIATVIVAGTYAYKRNTLASIIIGTVSYMLMVQFVFV